MQMKYLSLALVAAMATTGLTACGGDSDDKYGPPDSTPSTPDTGGDTGGNTGGDTGGNTGGDTGGNTGGDTGGNVNTEDNVGNAAEAFDITKKPSVVGQQYIRGSASNFDKTPDTNAKAADNGNATVLGGETLQNREMTNIVVAQYPDATQKDAAGNPNFVKYLLGEKPNANPDVTDPESIQANNDSTLADSAKNKVVEPLVHVFKDVEDNFTAYHQESKVNSTNTRLKQIATPSTTDTDNDVRVYGKLSSTAKPDTNVVNSARYLASDTNTVEIGTAKQFKVTPVHLDHVQYGRVTGNLEGLTAKDIAGKKYIRADFANKNFNGNTTQTDIYFYRGLNETALADMPAAGTFQYAGHALMYGIDNSYTGLNDNGQSNSVAFGSEAEAMGNFVKATFNADNKTVKGSVYNVWDRDVNDTSDSLVSVDLVEFNGNVTGNTIKGSANRTYKAGEATFKGSFYGSKAAEMGGSFNSVTKGYDKSEWGGVFGAEKITADVPETFVPPINAVE